MNYLLKDFKEYLIENEEKYKNGLRDSIEYPLGYIEVKEIVEEIERLTKRLEDSQLAFLQVNKENERLNNIINELEKESYLGMIENQNNNDYAKGLYTAYKYINDKLQELKGSDKECN